jgi:two-component system, NarL family, response regulator FusR
MWTAPAGTSTTSSVVERVRTLIVDDHPMFRLALREVLAREPDFEVIAAAGSVAEAIACLAHHTFDVAIVDMVLPDGRGSAFVDHVLNAQPDCKVLALSGVDEPTQMAEMLCAGASGFALKSQPVGEIVEALRTVLGGGRSVPAVSRDQIDKLLDSPDAWPLERLTPRERDVFDLLVGGYTNEGIAAKLLISRRTVETHRQRVMAKLAARSLGHLVQLAVRHGLAS